MGEQDIHQTIVIGVAAIIPHAAQADSVSVVEEIQYFIEESTQADIMGIERDIFNQYR